MTYNIIGTTVFGNGQQAFLALPGDGVHILGGVIVGSLDDVAVFGSASGLEAVIDGQVTAAGIAAVQLGDSALHDTDQRVFVGLGGIVRAQTLAVLVVGGDSVVVNYGQIGGGSAGVVFSGQGMGQSRLSNHGIIAADIVVTRNAVSENETLRLYNRGTIEGDGSAYDGLPQAASDIIINRGLMIGDVKLGGGDDRFDGRGAGEVLGTVFGGAGNDAFLLGYAEEMLYGGADIDTIDLSASVGVTLALDGSVTGAGRTLGDVYSGMNIVLGSLLSGDKLYGAASGEQLGGQGGSDLLEGRAGNDTLLGGTGNDRLVGEAGADALTGGLGDDKFLFRFITEAGDQISDFSGSVGNNDTIEIAIAGFAAGLVKGVLAAGQFVVRADNVAQDADDRFILRTSDRTLWFDNNGNGTGGLTMLAGFQPGFVLTAGDFLLV